MDGRGLSGLAWLLLHENLPEAKQRNHGPYRLNDEQSWVERGNSGVDESCSAEEIEGLVQRGIGRQNAKVEKAVGHDEQDAGDDADFESEAHGGISFCQKWKQVGRVLALGGGFFAVSVDADNSIQAEEGPDELSEEHTGIKGRGGRSGEETGANKVEDLVRVVVNRPFPKVEHCECEKQRYRGDEAENDHGRH